MNHPELTSTITRNDIGLLVFGSQHSQKREDDPAFPLLESAAEIAFSGSRIQHCWAKKLGVFPTFTRAALSNKNLRHETLTKDGAADTEADPEAGYLKSLNDLNALACEVLASDGHNPEALRIQLTTFQTEKRRSVVLKPRTRERQDAIATVKVGAGKFFQLTGGAALNDDDVFISVERKTMETKLTAMAADKKKRVAATER